MNKKCRRWALIVCVCLISFMIGNLEAKAQIQRTEETEQIKEKKNFIVTYGGIFGCMDRP